MKTFLITTLALLSGLMSLHAQGETSLQALIMNDENTFKGFIIASDDANILWKETENSTTRRKASLATHKVYFLQPQEFSEAMEAYKGRNYEAAQPLFKGCYEKYKSVRTIPGNYSTLAGFYEMDCARRLEDLDTLAALHSQFDPEKLLHEFHKTQFKIYGVFWDAVRTKSWARLDAVVMSEEWRNARLPGNLRTQICYCHGLALEGMNEPVRALNSYNGAFVGDFAATGELAKKAALNCMRILAEHPDVQLTMDLYNTEDYSRDSNGAFLIKEGTALLSLWDKTLGGGDKVPEKYKIFLKYPPK